MNLIEREKKIWRVLLTPSSRMFGITLWCGGMCPFYLTKETKRNHFKTMTDSKFTVYDLSNVRGGTNIEYSI